MYFVVFLLEALQNVVVPYTWVDGVNSRIEHFINYGVNSNLKTRVFWSDKPAAFDANGAPRSDYVPNIHDRTNEPIQFPNEGWYLGYLLKFKCMKLSPRKFI